MPPYRQGFHAGCRRGLGGKFLDLIIVRPDICNFFFTNVLLGSIFLHMKARKLWQIIKKIAYILHIWRRFLHHTYAICGEFHISPHLSFDICHLKFFHMWRNFQFPHNCHTWKAEISPQDNFFSTNNIIDISDKYQV